MCSDTPIDGAMQRKGIWRAVARASVLSALPAVVGMSQWLGMSWFCSLRMLGFWEAGLSHLHPEPERRPESLLIRAGSRFSWALLDWSVPCALLLDTSGISRYAAFTVSLEAFGVRGCAPCTVSLEGFCWRLQASPLTVSVGGWGWPLLNCRYLTQRVYREPYAGV